MLIQQDLPLSSAMRSLETEYAVYFNRKYHQTGHVFQGWFRSVLCDKASYLLELIRCYIHLNPVEGTAGACGNAADVLCGDGSGRFFGSHFGGHDACQPPF